jgi:hypothetical protein
MQSNADERLGCQAADEAAAVPLREGLNLSKNLQLQTAQPAQPTMVILNSMGYAF